MQKICFFKIFLVILWCGDKKKNKNVSINVKLEDELSNCN